VLKNTPLFKNVAAYTAALCSSSIPPCAVAFHLRKNQPLSNRVEKHAVASPSLVNAPSLARIPASAHPAPPSLANAPQSQLLKTASL